MDSIAGWIVTHRQPVMLNDARSVSRLFNGVAEATSMTTQSLLGVPLITKDKVIGALESVNKLSGEFSLQDHEMLITLGAQELQIAGNVPTALAALQTADTRLARLESPRCLPLRRVLARDIERLKAAPTVDITGIALKIDQLITGSEAWPLLADANPTSPARASPRQAPQPPRQVDWWEIIIIFMRLRSGHCSSRSMCC